MARGRSLAEFQKAFADEASCATFLFKRRWPAGFVCPACGKRRASSSSSLVSSGSARGGVKFALASACPYADEWRLAAARLVTTA